jgi:hypothetical protein
MNNKMLSVYVAVIGLVVAVALSGLVTQLVHAKSITNSQGSYVTKNGPFKSAVKCDSESCLGATAGPGYRYVCNPTTRICFQD